MEQKLEINEEVLKNLNNGHNFFNLKQTKTKHFINVMLETTQNLKEREEKIEVSTDLRWLLDLSWYNLDVNDFLKGLGDYVRKPLAKVRTTNRKNKISGWALDKIKGNFRKENLKFSDIEITIGKLAQEKLDEMSIDFEENVEKILGLQQTEENEEIQKKVDRFVGLKEKMLSLKTLIGKENSSRDYYSYDTPTDKTIKLGITPLEYNQSLKMIELEIREIAKEIKMGDIGDFDYKTIYKKLSYEKWLELNKVNLESDWEEFKEEEQDDDDDDDDVPKTFDDYAKLMFEQNGNGVVEVEWEGIPK